MWVGTFAVSLLIPRVAHAAQLITEEEARLPPPKGAIAADRRRILRGPRVEAVSPGETVHSPLRLQLKFEVFGGAQIDPDSVKVIYRTSNVDLAPRAKPFIRRDGINILDAELPAGEYTYESGREGHRRSAGQHDLHPQDGAVVCQ